MDVYFATLKYESVEQFKGYEVLNFLSKSTGKFFEVSNASLKQYQLPTFTNKFLSGEMSNLKSAKLSNGLYWSRNEARHIKLLEHLPNIIMRTAIFVSRYIS